MERFEFDGKTYVEKDAPNPPSCAGCAFDDRAQCDDIPTCVHMNRGVKKRLTIWVEEEAAEVAEIEEDAAFAEECERDKVASLQNTDLW